MSARDRLMADVERLALASALWYCGSQPMPLTTWTSPEDWDAWDVEVQPYFDAARSELAGIRDHTATLALLRSDRRTKRHARHALRRAGMPLDGYDWFPVPVQIEAA